MNISGSVGYTLLKRNDKYVLLLADVHDGVKYCEQDSVMIDNFLNVKENSNILLEEVLRENFTLTDLWPGSLHTQRLKQLNVKNHKIKPVDVRPMLLPFSWELIGMNKMNQNVSLQQYLSHLEDFFNYKSTRFNNNYIVPEMKKTFDKKNLIVKHFHVLKDAYDEFKKQNNKFMNTKMMYLYKNNSDILETLNNITSSIMEWYIIMLVHNSARNTIIHVGLAHSEQVLILLKGLYGFEIVENQGVNNMTHLHDTMRACLVVSPEINNLFNRKKYF